MSPPDPPPRSDATPSSAPGVSTIVEPTLRSAKTVRVRMTRQGLAKTRDEVREAATVFEHRFAPEAVQAPADEANVPLHDVAATQPTVPLIAKC